MVERKTSEIELKEKEIRELEQGYFTNLHIDSWFRNEDFDFIIATIKGCERTQNFEILTYISKYAYHLLKTYYLESYLNILKSVILFTAKIGYYGSPAITFLYDSPIDEIRLYCAANLDYTKFLNDKRPYITKVAKIREEVALKIRDEEVRERVEFLKSALENGLIEYKKLPDSEKNGDEYAINIQSYIFYHSTYKIFINKDIIDNMSDNKLVLASIIDDLIRKGEIILNNDFFQDLIGIQRKRKTINVISRYS